MNSKRLIIFISFFGVYCSELCGQNLVPNPSFEMHDTCPYNTSQIYYADFWFQPNIGWGTWQSTCSSDYYNSCGIGAGGVPSNFGGYQYPRTGDAYAGIAFFNTPGGGWEYLEVGLTDSLQAGKKYCGGYYVSRGTYGHDACNRQGAYFDSDSVFYNSPNYDALIKNQQIENQTIITDTSNWVLIKGAFVAQGGERFMVIGDFKDVDSITYVNTGSGLVFSSYYFVDDVFAEEMQIDTANAGGGKTICERDSVQLGTSVCGGCIYTWQPATGLSDTTTAQPLAFPMQTTTYILIVRDTTTGTLCDWTSMDSVTVTVIPFAPQTADAGGEKTLCKGESVTLGVPPCGNCTYQWQPAATLNNSATAQPTATPTQTTSYLLIMTDSVPPCAKTTMDSVNVFVAVCTELVEVYNIFTPNGDLKNDVFYIKNLPANSSLQIFNRWGSKVYSNSNYDNRWNGGGVPDGTYFYLLTLPDKKTFHGFVELRR
jgi:gliding motility-associated-like protein